DGVRIVPYYEQRTLVEACVRTVRDALLLGIVLVVVVLVMFLGGIRPAIVVGIAIPFSLLFATGFLKYLGFSANLMSLGGLSIAIGMLVDGTIVIVENVDRRLREATPSESRAGIIARACAEVGRPIVFAILIIIVVFLPLYTLQGVEGKTFRPLAIAVALAMAGSLVFAVLIAPVMADLLMRRPKAGAGHKAARENFVVRGLLVLYRPVLTFVMHRRGVAVTIAVGLIAVGLVVFPRLGSEFTPPLQEGTIILKLTMAPSISFEESKRITMIVERRLTPIPEVREIVTRIGRGEVGAHAHPINSAETYIALNPSDTWENAHSQEELLDYIRAHLGEIPGVRTNFTQPIAAAVDELLEGVRAELAVKLFGPDLDILKAKADEIADVVGAVRGAVDVQPDQVTGRPQLLIKIDRQAIARYGINVSDVQEVVSAAVGGESVGQIFEGIRRYDIQVRYQEQYRDTPEAIGRLLVHSPDGVWVPLRELATLEELVGPRQITRENNERFISIECNVHDRDIVSFVEEAQKAIDAQVDLPPGYLVTWGGQFKLQQEANRRLAVVIPITLLLVLILLFSAFGCLKNSLLIVFNIPLALVGGVVGLWISGQNLSVPASVGFIALFGIALENGMVLVTYINQLRAEGMSMDEASLQGAIMRLRPVLMTALTTGLGLTPLLFSTGVGSEVQRPLATVVLGGLITSTVLTLVVIPSIYKWFATKQVRA
ncbi:MAG: CusA/CzcA family heavy metal efflux RND transporter, partial [candidate division Zixibacteria bacterium]|nr:CusA/CzcA family heavy metal efflux RND transporter [candidate division Zixibacteria bacterium]